MKKILCAALFAAVAIVASAQSVTDALRFSVNDYYGTARSIAMGNAFTALGGDLGSVSINPAGSAVNSYSQVTLTPGINIMSGTADYSSLGYVGNNNPFTTTNNSQTRATMPNAAVMLNFNTRRKHGLRTVSFGISANASNYYNEDTSAGGMNDKTSYMGYLADFAGQEKMTYNELNSESYWNMSPYFWPAMVAYRSGMINESGNGEYVGAAQGITSSGYPVRGALDQSYLRSSRGCKYNMDINLGFNVDNKFYFGANLGVQDIDYKFDSYLRETGMNPSDFPVTIDGQTDYFNSMRFHEAYSARGTGIYGKFGVIIVPTPGFRIGAAIQTPVLNYMKEHLWYDGSTNFGRASGHEMIGADDEYIYEYKLISPYRVNAGVAYTLPGFGLLSVDYEMCDYSTMKFKETDNPDNSGFADSNRSIKNGAGISHMIRVGAEYKMTQNFDIRAGYNFTSSPERYINDSGKKVSPESYKHAVSLGVGYNRGAFFCDLATRCTINPDEFLYPYQTYDNDYLSPEILIKNRLWNVVMTLGLKF